MKILVTGGTGMVGSAFKERFPKADYPTRQELWSMTTKIFAREELKNKNIIHLAAKVGGLKANMENMADFYMENSILNERLLHAARIGEAKKVISLLSTCIYPKSEFVEYPLTENQLHLGPPHNSNYGYAYAKRMLDVMSRVHRQQYGCNFITAIPNNLYGENDNFDLENGHVIPSLIRKIWEAKINKANHIECWGDGSSLREFTYSSDIVKILMFLLKEYDGSEPINIGSTDEYSIREVTGMITGIMNYKGETTWNTDKPNGQHRKPTSNQKLLDLGWKKEYYTDLYTGLEKTCEWFLENYPDVRGVN